MSNELGILEKWYHVKKQIKDLQEKEEFLKYKIHNIMNQRQTNMVRSEYFTCARKVRTRRDIKKSKVPEEVWDEYAEEIEYPVLLLKKNRVTM